MGSADGLHWQRQTSPTRELLYSVTWNGNLYVVTGENGTILTSPDGIDWVLQESGTHNWLSDILWDGRHFVAVGENGTILISRDGKKWQTKNSGTSNSLYGIDWNGHQYVSVGRSGTIISSGDPDLAITGRTSPGPQDDKQLVTQEYTVSNDGDGRADEVHVDYELPADGIVIASHSGRGRCTTVDKEVNCQLGTLQYGEAAKLTLTAQAQSNSSVTASVSTPRQTDSNLDNNRISLRLDAESSDKGQKDQAAGTAAKSPESGPFSRNAWLILGILALIMAL